MFPQKMIQAKIFGGLLLILASLLWAFMRYSAEKKRLHLLRFYSGLALEIKRQIEMLDMPIDRIIESADMSNLYSILKVHPEKIEIPFLCELAEKELYAEDAEKVREFFLGLGRYFRDEEIRRSTYYSSAISDALSVRESEYGAKCRMYFTVSLCTSLGFIILII